MKIVINRVLSGQYSTIGILEVDNQIECFTCEDEHREVKVKGKTRIPEGVYKIKLRTEGAMHERYKIKFPGFHKGMLWLQNVPRFEWIYIHIGNTHEDTQGCILLGQQATLEGRAGGHVSNSTSAYKQLYQKVVKALEDGEDVTTEITNFAAHQAFIENRRNS